MLWVAVGLTFVAILVVAGALVYAFAPGEFPIADRLSRLWQPLAAQRKVSFRERQTQKAAQVLSDVGKLLPSSKDLSATKLMLVRAGYRRPEAIMALRGAKVLLPIVFAIIVYVSGLTNSNNGVFVWILALVAGFLLPDMWLSRRVRKRQTILRKALPDALDLLVVCIEAGLGLDQAFMRVSQELRITHPELCGELDLVNAQIRVGRTRIESMRELASRTGVDDIKALVAMLIQTDRFGTSVSQSLRVHADDMRMKRRQRAEEAAAKTPVKMVPPLVFFIFPALFVVILGPAIITIFRQFIGMHQ
ncbi:MAG: type II secretion system F family protein [Acidobacteria bacterium]|nr:MAG: type II secretion system F family protein [Acidobacteriota bacterium]